jgi:hypothetical protein
MVPCPDPATSETRKAAGNGLLPRVLAGGSDDTPRVGVSQE